MNSLSYRRALKLCTGFVLVASLAACSGSDKPSESEAKAAVATMLGDCQYVEVNDFKRNNGIAQQDGSYIVNVSYTITVKPSDDLRSYIENDYRQSMDDAKQRVTQAQTDETNWEQTRSAWTAAHPGQDNNDFLYSLSAEDQTRFNRAQMYATQKTPILNAYMAGSQKIFSIMRNDCPNTPHQLFAKVFTNQTNPDDLVNDTQLEASSVQIRMIKTDNGWQLAQ